MGRWYSDWGCCRPQLLTDLLTELLPELLADLPTGIQTPDLLTDLSSHNLTLIKKTLVNAKNLPMVCRKERKSFNKVTSIDLIHDVTSQVCNQSSFDVFTRASASNS